MMKKMKAGLAVVLVCSGMNAAEPVASLGGAAQVEFPDRDLLEKTYAASDWKMRWADEFDVPGLPDRRKWTFEEGMLRNNEEQYYVRERKENARVEDGCLIITARREKWEGAGITSASVLTRGRFAFRYGKLEICARLPEGRGTWPALWLMGSNSEKAGWPRCGEIDLMEFVGFAPDILHFTAHTAAFNHILRNQAGTAVEVKKLGEEFHRYGLLWTPEELVWFLDGKPVFRYANAHTGEDQWPFDQPFYILMNLAIGGAWGGLKGVDPGIFPTAFAIDYVRVWQRAGTGK